MQLDTAWCVVNVRILLAGDQHGARIDHGGAEIAVQVQQRADRQLGPDQGAHRLQQVALAVRIALGQHRAMQSQQHGIHRQRGLQVGEQLVTQLLVVAARQRPRGLGLREQARQQHIALRGRRLQRAAEHRLLDQALQRTGLAAPYQHAFAEGLQAGGQRREAVGLVDQAGEEEFQGFSTTG